MAQKYELKYNDVENIEHELKIFDDSYSGDVININGTIILTHKESSDNLETIRGQGLRVSLEADASLTFDDLFSEQDKVFKTEYKRNNVILFIGWINSEGFYEDYVNDKWIVSFDCIDGLGYLKNLAFVNDDGTNIKGRRTYIDLLSKALKRTGSELNINIKINIHYRFLNDENEVFSKIYANSERYIKEDGETTMTCEEVVLDLLSIFAACLVMRKGEWYVFRPTEMFLNDNISFFRYDYNGDALSPSEVSEDLSFEIGSQIDDYYPHYCNGNQRIENEKSMGAFKVNYKYGFRNSLINNNNFLNTGGAVVQAFNNWQIDSFFYGDGSSSNDLIYHSQTQGDLGVIFLSRLSRINNILTSDPINTTSGDSFSLSINWSSLDGDTITSLRADVRLYLDTTSNGSFEYNSTTKSWVNSVSFQDAALRVDISGNGLGSNGIVTNENSSATPYDGDMYVDISSMYSTKSSTLKDILLNSVVLSVNVTDNGFTGENHTIQRTINPSTRVDDVKEVKTGDNVSDVFNGTIYKSDALTPTNEWERSYQSESKPLLRIMAEENMRSTALTMRVFSGDVYGFFDYLSIVEINGISGKFLVTKYQYDTNNNIIQAEFKQIYGNEINENDLQYSFSYEGGIVVKPTIRG